MKLADANPLRWNPRKKRTTIIVIACLLLGAWLLIPTRRNIDPAPWINRSSSWPVKIFAWPNDRMSIVLIGEGSKMKATEIHGVSLYADVMQNPAVYGVENLPAEFTGKSTNLLAGNWFSRKAQAPDYYETHRLPVVLLEIQNMEIVAALGVDQLIWRKLPTTQQPPLAHPACWDWRECRYENHLPIVLHDCNPEPRLSNPEYLQGAAPTDVICKELEVDSSYPYYVLTTRDNFIASDTLAWIGSGQPYLHSAQPWLIIPNPLIRGETDACRIVQPKE